jgi:hypothetical protein
VFSLGHESFDEQNKTSFVLPAEPSIAPSLTTLDISIEEQENSLKA